MTRKDALAVAAIAIACALSCSGCGLHGRPEVSRKQARVGIVAADRSAAAEPPDPQQVVAPGLVEAWGGEIAVSPEESGSIARLVAKEGESVAAGQLLAVLDDRAQRAAVALARAEVAEAEAVLARMAHGATDEELRQARADAEASQVRATWARSDAERMSGLGQRDAIAKAVVERTDADARALDATARGSAARRSAVERGARLEDRDAARARLAAARARLELAEAGVARRQVVAPQAGTVLLSRFHPGEFYSVGGAPLFVLGDVSRLQVRLEVDEIDALRLQPGAPCAILGDDSIHISDGKVSRLAPKMGRRGLPIESPTARADVRVREVFLEVPATSALIPGQRVWGHAAPVARGQ